MSSTLPLTKIRIGIARVLYKAIKVFYRKNEIIRSRNGINLKLDLSEGIDLSIFLFGAFQKHIFSNISIGQNQPVTIVDVGANIGSMSLMFAKKYPNAQIIAFEPTHYAFNKFQENLKLNPGLSKRINLFQGFVSDKNDDSPAIKAFSSWKVGRADDTGELHPVHLGTAKGTEGVFAKTLDWYCNKHNIENVKLIKIDTDGHEFKVLTGAVSTIAKYKPIIVFEVGQYLLKEVGIDFSWFINWFTERNYTLYNVASLKHITADNWSNTIPQLRTIDILAMPK